MSLFSGLPSQEGRLQILNIHTAKLRNEKKLSEDVSLEVLSVETKNFSGAEIEGLVRAAATTSMNKLVKVGQHYITLDVNIPISNVCGVYYSECSIYLFRFLYQIWSNLCDLMSFYNITKVYLK